MPGFEYPALLWAFPFLAGFLVWVYLRRGRGKQILVSSVILLKGLHSPASSRRKFVPPMRFFFELLIFGLLLAALAGLVTEVRLKRYAVVVDNSFSMAAMQNQSGLRLLDFALLEATSLVNSLDSEAQVEVIATSQSGRSISAGFQDRGAAAQTLSKIKLGFSEDNLQELLDKLSFEEKFERVFVFSDRISTATLGSDLAKQDPRFIFHPLNEAEVDVPRGNVAISSVELQGKFAAEQQRGLSVTLSNYGKSDIKGKLLLSAVDSKSFPFSFHDIQARNLALKAGGSERVVFEEMPADVTAFRVHFDTLAPGAGDLIGEDNTAWVATEGNDEHVVVVSDLSSEVLGLSSMPGIKFVNLKPEEYGRAASQVKSRALIFHRFLPAQLPDSDALFVMPAGQSDWLRAGKDVASVDITGWLSIHPLLSYLNFEAISLRSSRTFTPPVWARELISSNAGSIAFAGEFAGHRYVTTGFELFPFEGKKQPLLSVLTLNILKWLTSLGDGSGYKEVGSVLVPRDLESRLFYMDGSEIEFAESAADRGAPARSPGGLLPQPGLYTARAGEKTVSVSAANFFSEAESNLLKIETVKIPEKHTIEIELTGRQNLSLKLMWIALLLLLIDLGWAVIHGVVSARAGYEA